MTTSTGGSRIARFRLPLRLAVLVAAVVLIAAGYVAVWPAGSSSSPSSFNWSGYAIMAPPGSVSSVSALWTQPPVLGSCPAFSDTYAMFWVGIDGWGSTTDPVEQVGTENVCAGGIATESAFYEFYPGPMVLISSIRLQSGDRVDAVVSYSNGTFTIGIADLTSGASFENSTYAPSEPRSSAEWIVEAPQAGATSLTDFGRVNFTSVGVTIGGRSGVLGSFPDTYELSMTNLNSTYQRATPTSIDSETDGFTVTWLRGAP
jgi:hypothetical protein